MLIPIGEIKPSPFNPKRPMPKRKLAALRRNIEKFGFQRSVLVCRNFDTGEGYYCLDGHTALEIFRDLGNSEVECRVVDTVRDRKSLGEFISGYAVVKEPLVYEIYSELGDMFGEVYGETDTFFDAERKLAVEQKAVEVEEQTSYFLQLPPDMCARLKKVCATKAFRADKEKFMAERILEAEDEPFLSALCAALFTESGDARPKKES